MSSRQTEIIEKLQHMKRELAKKERRLRKLKRSVGGSSSSEGNVLGSPRLSSESTPQGTEESSPPQRRSAVSETHGLCQTIDQSCHSNAGGTTEANVTATSNTVGRKESPFKAISRLLFSDSSTEIAESGDGSQAAVPNIKKKRIRQCTSTTPRTTRSCTSLRKLLDWLLTEAKSCPAKCFAISDDVQLQALILEKLEQCKADTKSVTHSTVESPQLHEQNGVSGGHELKKSLCQDAIIRDKAVRNEVQRNGEDLMVSATRSEECPKQKLLGLDCPLKFYRCFKCRFEDPLMALSIVEGRPAVLVGVHAAGVSFWNLEGTCFKGDCVSVHFQHRVEESHCTIRGDSSLYVIHIGATCDVLCIQYSISERSTDQYVLGPENGSRRRMYLLTKLQGTLFAMATKSSCGSTRVKSCEVEGQTMCSVGEVTETLHSLTNIENLPSALFGASHEAVYVWDYTKCILIRKIIWEPNIFPDISRISWAASHSGLVFCLAHWTDESRCQLTVLNPFSGKGDVIGSYTWAPMPCDGTHCLRSVQVHKEYIAAVCRPLGVCIWNLWSGNLVAQMHYGDATSVALTTVGDTCYIAAVGCRRGHILIFVS